MLRSARAELRDWSAIAPIVLAGIGLAGWGLCFYTALNVREQTVPVTGDDVPAFTAVIPRQNAEKSYMAGERHERT